MLRRRLIPAAALAVAIGASAAGAATAAATGSGSGSRSGSGAVAGAPAGQSQKPASCKVELPGHTFKKGTGSKTSVLTAGEKAKLAAAGGKGQVESKTGGQQPADPCVKKVETVSLDQIATELGVSKAALVQALDQSKQWVAATRPTPGVAQFEQHLAGLLNVPVAKVAAVFKPGPA